MLLVTVLIGTVRASDVSIGVDIGVLSNQNGVTLSDGSLILLIASSSGNWQPITAGQYVSGDEIVVAATAASSAISHNAGETAFTWQYNYADIASFSPGAHIAVVWFPDITYSNYATLGTLPVSGNSYGLFSATTDLSGGCSWVAQPGGTYLGYADGYVMNTAGAGGAISDSQAKASNTVTGVPEPSSVVLLVAGGFLMTGALLRRRKVA